MGTGNGPATAATAEYEIAGVVADLFAASRQPTMYRLLAPGEVGGAGDGGETFQVRIALRAGRTIPPKLAGRLGEIAAALDPALRVGDVQTLEEIYGVLSGVDYGAGVVMVALALCGVLFSVAGIYTSMAFTVVQRRREIGIRSALGAAPWRLVAGIFRSVLRPIGFGVPLGALEALLLEYYLAPLLLEGERPSPWILPAVETFIVLIAAAALAGPVRRALRVNAVEALRDN
jgi:hypothetical protein